MAAHLPEVWHTDIGHFSDAIRDRQLPPTVFAARAPESVERFHEAAAYLARDRA